MQIHGIEQAHDVSSGREGVLRGVLVALLLANSLMELGGGVMMIVKPARIASGTFGLESTGSTAPLMAVIGGATLAYALVSGAAVVALLQRRDWARSLVLLLGAMLIVVGAVMLVSGLRVGGLDLAKGVVFVAGGLAYRRS